LEECYEVLEAIDGQDSAKLREELGDLLMQVVLQAQIAAEDGEFQVGDVVHGINTKLIRRHPHVFGSQELADADAVRHSWQAIKKQETGVGSSILASIPRQLPALSYSQAMQQRVAQVGFDWEDISGVIDKLAEEVTEFRQARDQEELAREFGDLLFTLVNIARRQGFDVETALREANQRFYRRFTYMEEVCRQRGLEFNVLSFEDQNALWEAAKEAME